MAAEDGGRPGKRPPKWVRKKRRRELRKNQRTQLSGALTGLADALTRSGLQADESRRFASIILSRPGVMVGREGRINYRGKRYEPAAFATSALTNFVTGRRAERLNKAAIEGDPGYMQALSSLGLDRDLGTSAIDDRRRRAVLDFGDPRFATDNLLGAEAAANPFSTSRLLGQAYGRDQSAMRQASSRLGTIFGGGGRAGQAAASRVNASRQTEATRGLTDLLAGLDDQAAGLARGYETGRTGALQEATGRLMSSGQIHAAQPPNYRPGAFRFWRGPKRRFSGLL